MWWFLNKATWASRQEDRMRWNHLKYVKGMPLTLNSIFHPVVTFQVKRISMELQDSTFLKQNSGYRNKFCFQGPQNDISLHYL